MSDSTYSVLSEIIIKVRRLTRSPSESQITDDQITKYINTFVLYDFPEQLRVFQLRKNLTFYTQPYVDVYGENVINTLDPLYNFKNKYISVHPPIYVSGNEVFYTQAEDQFYRLYPKITNQNQIFTGDGITTAYTGTVTGAPIYRNTVIFSSLDSSNMGITLTDMPLYDVVTGNPTQSGNLLNPAGSLLTSYGTINYITGVYSVNFPTAPAAGKPIYLQTVQYQVNVPQAVLYFNSQFVLRPVPDKAYAIQMDVMQRPSELFSGDSPELAEWFQYISYGAAKKVFEDRMDLESVVMITPELKNQENLMIRRTIKQYGNDRASTIYTDQSEALVSGWGRGGWF